MKKYLFLFVLFTSIIVFGCTENNSDVPKENSKKNSSPIATKVINPNDTSVYISPKMAEIINMIDTSKKAIPIEKLIPSINNIKNTRSQNIINSDYIDNGTTVLRGYDDDNLVYRSVQTEITEAQRDKFNMAEEKEYVTCYAVTKSVRFNSATTLENIYLHGDTIGINPDDLNTFGYKIENRYNNILYRFTTYIWFISRMLDEDGTIAYPEIPERVNIGIYHAIPYNIFLQKMTWRFYEFN